MSATTKVLLALAAYEVVGMAVCLLWIRDWIVRDRKRDRS